MSELITNKRTFNILTAKFAMKHGLLPVWFVNKLIYVPLFHNLTSNSED